MKLLNRLRDLLCHSPSGPRNVPTLLSYPEAHGSGDHAPSATYVRRRAETDRPRSASRCSLIESSFFRASRSSDPSVLRSRSAGTFRPAKTWIVLHEKFDFPDPAGPQLHVAMFMAPLRHFRVNHILHCSHVAARSPTPFSRSILRRCPQDERLDQLEKRLPDFVRAGDRPGLQQSQSFPHLSSCRIILGDTPRASEPTDRPILRPATGDRPERHTLLGCSVSALVNSRARISKYSSLDMRRRPGWRHAHLSALEFPPHATHRHKSDRHRNCN